MIEITERPSGGDMQKVDLRLVSRQTAARANAVAYYAEKARNAKNEAEKVMYLRHTIEGIEVLISTKEILEDAIGESLHRKEGDV